ncbi:hypothetical protein ACWKWP_13020 [Agromyces soli]
MTARREAHVKWIKPLAIGLVVVFALFYMISRPEDAANLVQGAVNGVATAVDGVGRFFTSLAS